MNVSHTKCIGIKDPDDMDYKFDLVEENAYTSTSMHRCFPNELLKGNDTNIFSLIADNPLFF